MALPKKISKPFQAPGFPRTQPSTLGARCTLKGGLDPMLTVEGTGTRRGGLTLPSEAFCQVACWAQHPDPAAPSPPKPQGDGMGMLGQATQCSPANLCPVSTAPQAAQVAEMALPSGLVMRDPGPRPQALAWL